MKFQWLAASAALIVVGMLPMPAHADSVPQPDFSIPARYSMLPCSDNAQLDCIESMSVISESGINSALTYVGFKPQTEFNGQDNYGNLDRGGLELWSDTGSGSNQTLEVNPLMETPTFACCVIQGTLKRFGSIRTNIKGLRDRQTLNLVMRTSWLKPLNLALSASHASFVDEKIPGGHRWSLTLSNSLTHQYQTNASGTWASKVEGGWVAPADVSFDEINFVIDHAGINDDLSPYPVNPCIALGYTGSASNSSAAGQPYWDGNSLAFAIEAPHLTPQNELNHGYFQFWATTAYLDCMWPGNSLSHSTSFTVSVVEADGVQRVETAGASVKNGMFHLWVDDFHYSSPTIKVQANDSAPVPAKSPAPATPKVRCRQIAKPHKLITISGSKKTCPKGYSKTT